MASGIRSLHLSPRAIIYGCLADIGVTFAGSIAITVVALSANSDLVNLESTLRSPGFAAAGLVLGLAATILGGYVAARNSPGAELTNALAVGVVIILVGVLVQVGFRVPLDLWSILGFIVTIPAAGAGGYLRVAQLEQSTTT